MDNTEKSNLEKLVLAPYLQKATALIGKRRRVGGNQFRHAVATLGILIDYKYTDPVLPKASIIHDLFEDIPETDPPDIESIDADGEQVVKLVLEVSRRSGETKIEYLKRFQQLGSERARILKVADRLSNMTDLHLGVFSEDFVRRYIAETVEFIVPVAKQVNSDMAVELCDLVETRRLSLGESP